MLTKSASSTTTVWVLRSPGARVAFSAKDEFSMVAKYSDLWMRISECAYRIRLRAMVRPDEEESDEMDNERWLCGVSVPGLLGAGS